MEPIIGFPELLSPLHSIQNSPFNNFVLYSCSDLISIMDLNLEEELKGNDQSTNFTEKRITKSNIKKESKRCYNS